MEIKRAAMPLAIKAVDGPYFEGYGSVFGNVDLGGDIVAQGAFTRSLKAHDREGTTPLLLWMHKVDQVAGRWLEMREDARGLFVRGELADTTLGREVRTLLKMGAVKGLSIGYVVTDSDYNRDGNRVIKGADLVEVSVVSLPMNPAAQVTAAKVDTIRDFEHVARDAFGLSRRDARRFATHAFPMYQKARGDVNADVEELADSINLSAVGAMLRAAAAKIRGM